MHVPEYLHFEVAQRHSKQTDLNYGAAAFIAVPRKIPRLFPFSSIHQIVEHLQHFR